VDIIRPDFKDIQLAAITGLLIGVVILLFVISRTLKEMKAERIMRVTEINNYHKHLYDVQSWGDYEIQSHGELEMMKQAHELQEYWRNERGPKVGDWTDKGYITAAHTLNPHPYFMVYNREDCLYRAYERKDLIWHPTIEQLMGMLDDKFDNNIWIMLSYFKRFAHPMDNHGIKTMKQLWLAFVYHENYNKRWDVKWVKD
jgi:hypothetical protein